jgi:hypothetical protein
MIRDYAPFASGTRHQLTLFFNLATLYEHTWDVRIGQVLKEYADAFLDPGHRMGVWRCQENGLPARAEAPIMAHYWVPALWKYERATGDPRMKEVFARYFDACYVADPFREDVGNYSPVHLGYAYHFTRDPRHLGPALWELERLLPHAEPLKSPEELGRRIYNPYATIETLTAVPRLIWALAEARRNGVAIPAPPPLAPQRTAIALRKAAGQPLAATLWGYDRELTLIGPDAKPYRGFQVRTQPYASRTQPFDRVLPQFQVFLHHLTVPAGAPAGIYILSLALEMAVLELQGGDGPLCSAARPVALAPGAPCFTQVPDGVAQLRIESAEVEAVRVVGPEGEPLEGRRDGDAASFALPAAAAGKAVRIEAAGSRPLWFRIAGWPEEACWVSFGAPPAGTLPPRPHTLAALRPAVTFDAGAAYVPGRFGRALQIVPGRELRFPDHVVVEGKPVPLCSMEQGTIEFWVRRLWDERVTRSEGTTYLTNGQLTAAVPWRLPVGEWAHVAMVWRPFKRDPSKTVLYFYVNGLDQANYRSVWWEGYSRGAYTLSAAREALHEFVSRAGTGTAFALDDLRISRIARYADPDATFGGQQTYNPFRFEPPEQPLPADADTLLLFRFDGDVNDAAGWAARTAGTRLEGRLSGEGKE